MQVFYGYVIPGADLNTFTCHGLACGAVYITLIDSVLSVCIGLMLYGLPAALLAGSLVGALGSARRAPTVSPSATLIQ